MKPLHQSLRRLLTEAGFNAVGARIPQGGELGGFRCLLEARIGPALADDWCGTILWCAKGAGVAAVRAGIECMGRGVPAPRRVLDEDVLASCALGGSGRDGGERDEVDLAGINNEPQSCPLIGSK